MNIGSRPLFIDTCALSDKDFIDWLTKYTGKKSISSVVYMEFSLYLFSRGKEPDDVEYLLKKMEISVSPFTKKCAKNAAIIMEGIGNDRRCRMCGNINWNDCIIAADTPCAPSVLVTKNIKHFEMLLDWKGRLKTPAEVMSKSY